MKPPGRTSPVRCRQGWLGVARKHRKRDTPSVMLSEARHPGIGFNEMKRILHSVQDDIVKDPFTNCRFFKL
jgi:hypothetical protein